eukprot:TRINITY_DN605_c1_g1_i1.p1 TRINITY_DN605_c1_g1~~TRINITY_DN605_c1_g1_i1.p1  ORF type:complete len:108 (-),score=32.03 TRINITY_DN605_c1_g1_i1:78-401(-)
MSNKENYGNYRKMLKEIELPCIPYIGIFLTDFVFVEDGNKDYVEESNLVNVTKMRFIASILYGLNRFQHVNYNFKVVPTIQAYLLTLQIIPDDELKRLSLAAEPRGK